MLLLSVCRCFPQGQIVFDNRVNNVVVAPIYGVEPTNRLFSKHGNTASGTPAGSQTYGGSLLSGRNFTAQLFAGPTNATDADLKALEPQVNFRTNTAAGFVIAPAFAVTVSGVPEGERARVQLRVWNNRGGAVTNWEEAVADFNVERGQSLSFISDRLGGVFIPPPNLIGLQSFNLALREDSRLSIRMTNSVGMLNNCSDEPMNCLPELALWAAPAFQYKIEFRTVFAEQSPWQPLTNFTLFSSPAKVLDTTAEGYVRFYRAARVQ